MQRKELKKKVSISLILVLWYLILPQRGYSGYGITEHLYGMMSHANVWHLACNIFCLCSLKNRIRIIPSFLIAFLCTFIPTWYDSSIGFSGVIFAILGIEWGEVGQFKQMCKLILPFILLTLLIPNMNALLHLYSLLCGYGYVKIFERLKGERYDIRR